MTNPDSPVASRFLQATYRTPGPRTKGPVTLLVLHATAGKEVKGGAWGVARWFADPKTRRASAHYTVDDVEAVQSVLERDVAWGAAGANRQGIHIEHVGLATQTEADWQDPYSHAELQRSVRLAADICQRNSISPVWLNAAALKANPAASGITTHYEVEKAWPSSGHTDPGRGFPQAWYVSTVAALMAPAPPKQHLALWRDQKTGAVFQPTHLSPAQWEALKVQGWPTINADLPPETA